MILAYSLLKQNIIFTSIDGKVITEFANLILLNAGKEVA